jgi:hypothetical protein
MPVKNRIPTTFKDEALQRATYRALFSTPAGSEVLEDLMARNYFFEPMIGGAGEHNMAYLNGRRDAILDIIGMGMESPPKPPQFLDMWDRIQKDAENVRRNTD